MTALRAACVILLAATAFAAVVPGGGFVFDDHVLIERNRDLAQRAVWREAFARDYYATSEQPGVSGYYRPIAVLANAFDVQVWRSRARGAHLSNIVLHVAASLSLPAALIGFGMPAAAAWVAAFVFAAHPVHAESVAFVSGRVDVLATLFTLWTLALLSLASRVRLAWLGVGATTLLAFLSKEIAAVLPILAVVAWWPRRKAGVPKVALAAMIVAGVVTLVLRANALGGLFPTTATAARPAGATWLPLQTLLFAVESLYAPMRRLSMEPHPSQLELGRIVLGLGVAGAVWVAAFILAPALRSALRRCAVAGAVSLLPVLNLLPQETQLSERFFYLASGFLLAPVGVLAVSAWTRGRTWRWAASMAVVAVLGWLLSISSWRAAVWRTDLSLWQCAVQEEPQRAAFWDRLGLSYTERRQWAQAEPALRRAVELDPTLFNGWHNLGVLLGATRRHAEAAEAYTRALELQPRSVSAHVNLGRMQVALRDVGAAYESFAAATAIKPDYVEAHRLAGMTALRMDHLDDAERHLRTAARLAPDNASIQQALRKLEERKR